MPINHVLHLQTEAAHAYMRKHGLSAAEFSELDRKYNILRFIEIGYEIFHLEGIEGVVEEIEDYISGDK